MKIWVDGDACPLSIKDILFRAAIRTKTPLFIVANHYLSVPPSPFLKLVKVSAGFDMADNHIINNIAEHELAVTADIPLAHSVVEKKAIVLNPRGDLYTDRNIKEVLAFRNLNEILRSTGVITGGSAKLSAQEINKFANQLDKQLSAAR